MAHPPNPSPAINKAEFDRLVGDIVRHVVAFCAVRGLGESAVVATLFAAAGSYGYGAQDKSVLPEELKKFIATTRKLYPNFDSDVGYGNYLDYLMQYAMAQKRESTVH